MGEKTKSFRKKDVRFYHFYSLEVLATAIRLGKEMKGIQIGKEEAKLSLFADDTIVYIQYPIGSTKKLLNLINEFGKTAGYKVSPQKSKAFFYINNETSETEIRGKNPIQYSNKKNKVCRNKPNQGDKRPVLRKLHDTEERN